MKRETYFAVTGVVGLLFGLGFLVLPGMSLATYGVPTDAHNLMQSRYFGSALIGIGLVSFLGRQTQDPVAYRAMLVGGLVSDVIGAAISFAAAGGLQNRMAWLSVAIYALFAAGAAYFLFAGKPQPQAQGA